MKALDREFPHPQPHSQGERGILDSIHAQILVTHPNRSEIMAEPIYVAKGDSPLYLLPQLANRHGLIAGATGTGKTVTLQVIAEGLSRAGVSV